MTNNFRDNVVDIKTKKKSGKIIGVLIIAVILLILLLSSISTVPAGSTGVVTTFGKVSESTYS